VINTNCSCHPDPDFSVELENNPDLVADHVSLSEIADVDRENNEVNLNSTISSVFQNNGESKVRGLLSLDEQMTTKAVPLSTYIGYLRAVASKPLIIGMLASFIVADSARFFQQYTVAKWTDLVTDASSMTAAMGSKYLSNIVYAAGVLSLFLWLRSLLLMLVGLRASNFYHNRMVSSVFRAPMSFFDATPSGQILSRFGKELETVDRALPETISSVFYCFLQIVGSVAALSGAISPAMFLPMTFAGALYLRIMKRFRPAARDLKRSEQRTRSPIYTHFGEAIRGTEVIRSVPMSKQVWSSQNRKLENLNLSVYSTVKALDRWLSINLEAIGNTLVFITAIASVFLTQKGRLRAGSAAWGLTQSLSITGLMAWAVRNLTMLESHMMSVQRVSELTDVDEENKSAIPKESTKVGDALKPIFAGKSNISASPITDDSLIQGGWPWKGGIEF